MKKTLLIILFITGVCFGQTYQLAEEFYENGLPKAIKTYKVSKGKIELVKAITWHENGQKWKEYTYKDGEKDVLWTFWNENGQKSSEVTYKDGELDGLMTEWYENGQKRYEGSFKDGNIDINAFKSVFVIDGRFNCFYGSKSIAGGWVNDNECDCSDCSDEPLMKR